MLVQINTQHFIKNILKIIVFFPPDVPNFGSSLNILTESKVPTISKILGKPKNQAVRPKTGHILDPELMTILYFLFPDADTLQVN